MCQPQPIEDLGPHKPAELAGPYGDHTEARAAQIVQGPSAPANKRPHWHPGTGAYRRSLCGDSLAFLGPQGPQILRPVPLSRRVTGLVSSRGEVGKRTDWDPWLCPMGQLAELLAALFLL